MKLKAIHAAFDKHMKVEELVSVIIAAATSCRERFWLANGVHYYPHLYVSNEVARAIYNAPELMGMPTAIDPKLDGIAMYCESGMFNPAAPCFKKG